MALMSRYNPPPNWPAPPPGWTPPPGWQPDPAWGPPPDGWQLWVQERANPQSWQWAFIAASAYFAALLVVMAAVTGFRVNAVLAGEFMFAFLVAAIVVGAVGRSRPRHWSVGFYFLLVFGVFLGVRFLSVLGQGGFS